MTYLFGFLLVVTSVFMILLILVQRGRGGGLTGALGGMGGQSAFGTKAGDLFTRITMGVAIFWLLLCAAMLKSTNAEQSMFNSKAGANARQDAQADSPKTIRKAGDTGTAGDKDKANEDTTHATTPLKSEKLAPTPEKQAGQSTEKSAPPEAPAKDAPAKDAPAKDAPAKDAPAKDAPAKDAPAKDAPAKDAPAKDAPAKDAPAKDAPAEKNSADKADQTETTDKPAK